MRLHLKSLLSWWPEPTVSTWSGKLHCAAWCLPHMWALGTSGGPLFYFLSATLKFQSLDVYWWSLQPRMSCHSNSYLWHLFCWFPHPLNITDFFVIHLSAQLIMRTRAHPHSTRKQNTDTDTDTDTDKDRQTCRQTDRQTEAQAQHRNTLSDDMSYTFSK